MTTVHLVIKGKVQGVFFRVAAKEKADALGVTGWVKNTPEGNVEITARGQDDKVQEFMEWCKTGPEYAVVKEVEVHSRSNASFQKFSIKR